MADTQVSAAKAPDFPPKNRVVLAGTITAVGDSGFQLETKNMASNGIEYTETHPVVCDMAAAAHKPDVGQRIMLAGRIQAGENRIQRVHAYPQTIQLIAAEAMDWNECQIAGKIGTTSYTPADSILQKQGFARSFVNVAKPGDPAKNIRVLMFQDMGRIWAKVPAGSDVVIHGRVRNRQRDNFVTSDGDVAIYTEVIANPDGSRVLRANTKTSLMAKVDFAALEDTPAPATESKAEPEPEALVQPATKGKRGKKDPAPENENF